MKPRSCKSGSYISALIVVLVGLGLLALIFLPVLPGQKRPRRLKPEGLKLRSLANMMWLYSQDNDGMYVPADQWQEKLARWLNMPVDDDAFFHIYPDGSRAHYIYVNPPVATVDELDWATRGNTPMLYEHPSVTKNATFIVFWDLRVSCIDDKDFLNAFANVTNPDGTSYIPVGLDAVDPN